MLINFYVTEQGRRDAPAVVHIDETARPQIQYREDNPQYYVILAEFYKMTDVPILINTYFNIHGEMNVHKPVDAILELEDGMVDVLSMEEYVVMATDDPPVDTSLLDEPRTIAE